MKTLRHNPKNSEYSESGMEETSFTKKEILTLVEKLEEVTGITCQHVRQLDKKATDKDYWVAWKQDRAWFRGYADTIYNLT